MLESRNAKLENRDANPVDFLQEEIVLPFYLVNNCNFEELKLCVIPVILEGIKTKQVFDLLVDTGSEITVLNENVANIIGVEMNEGSIGTQGISGKSKLRRGRVKNIEIVQRKEVEGKEVEGRISLGFSNVMVGKLLGKFADYSILGILGAETIQEICLKIDYPRKYLELSQVL